MKLPCPNCGEVIDVPDKAMLFWSHDCPGCRIKLQVVITEFEDASRNDDSIDFVLRAVEPKSFPEACLPSSRGEAF